MPYRETHNGYKITYLASEGFIAFQTRPDTTAMKLANKPNGIYFEFIPFDPKYIKSDGSLTMTLRLWILSEVEDEPQDYALVHKHGSGHWRYFLLVNTIEFTELVERAEIKNNGFFRNKFFLNTVGSQLSVPKN